MTTETFPPLKATDEAPLHGAMLPRGCFWACDYPERPYDEDRTWWDWRCPACTIHASAVLASEGDLLMPWSATADGKEPNDRSLSWLVQRSSEALGIPFGPETKP